MPLIDLLPCFSPLPFPRACRADAFLRCVSHASCFENRLGSISTNGLPLASRHSITRALVPPRVLLLRDSFDLHFLTSGRGWTPGWDPPG